MLIFDTDVEFVKYLDSYYDRSRLLEPIMDMCLINESPVLALVQSWKHIIIEYLNYTDLIVADYPNGEYFFQNWTTNPPYIDRDLYKGMFIDIKRHFVYTKAFNTLMDMKNWSTEYATSERDSIFKLVMGHDYNSWCKGLIK